MEKTTTVTKTRGRPAKAKVTDRPMRVPMSGSRKRMHIDEEFQDPDFHYAWINDQNDLVFRAKRAGFVNVELGEIPGWGNPDVDAASSTSSFVTMGVGQGTTAYLMKQPMEYYLEDRESMDALVESRESDMKKSLNSGEEGTYGEVKFS